mmetsp:Transcript_39543/g.104780  ORF Transcript_39543/g.104780 Transcript_39543/m.104780 type:complete len:325 (+) Transcript_39543:601-1575(+)
MRVGDIHECVVCRVQHTRESNHDEQATQSGECRGHTEDQRAPRLSDRADDFIAHIWMKYGFIAALASALLRLQQEKESESHSNPQTKIRNRVDLQHLYEQIEHPHAAERGVLPPATPPATEECPQVEHFRYAEHVSLRLGKTVVQIATQLMTFPAYRVIQARQDNRLNRQFEVRRKEAFDEHVVIFCDDVAILCVCSTSSPTNLLQRSQRQAVGRKRNLKLTRIDRAHHLLRCNVRIQLPDGCWQLPKVASRNHAGLKHHELAVGIHAPLVGHVRKIIWVIQRVCVRHMNQAIFCFESLAAQNVLLNFFHRPFEIRCLSWYISF